MREIRFRVWFYDGQDDSTGEYISIGAALSEDIVCFDSYSLFAADECAVIEQFTGLYDADGREVWEGDILNKLVYTTGGPKGKSKIARFSVYYSVSGYGGFHLRRIGGIDSYRTTIVTIKDCTVIGNIHENPELLDATRES